MTIDWWTLGLQTINFLIVVWLLSRFLYRPIRRIIEDREAADQSAAADAQQKKQDAEATRRKYEEKLADFERQQREKESKLHAEIEQECRKTLDAAAEDAEKLVTDARARMAAERNQALENLQNSIADMARDLAAKALHDTGSPSAASTLAMVNDYFDGLGESALSDLRADFTASPGGVDVITASELPEDARTKWQDLLKTRLGDGPVNFEIDPEILAGIEFHFPHARLSFSAAERIDRIIAAMKEG